MNRNRLIAHYNSLTTEEERHKFRREMKNRLEDKRDQLKVHRNHYLSSAALVIVLATLAHLTLNHPQLTIALSLSAGAITAYCGYMVRKLQIMIRRMDQNKHRS